AGDGAAAGAAGSAGCGVRGAEQPAVKMSKPPKTAAAMCALNKDVCMCNKSAQQIFCKLNTGSSIARSSVSAK
ncbi:MAG: hypothetical protein D6768_20870, partial [Chloroflexi bacterium]